MPPNSTKRTDTSPARWDYAAAPESTAILNVRDRYELFINGEWVKPKSKKYFTTASPATLKPLAQVAEAGVADVDRAVKAARRAYEDVWSKLSGAERGRYLFRIARILQERAREFAVLESLDGGKPIKESRDIDMPLAAGHFFYYAGWADKLDMAFPGKTARPVGVAAQIIPWN
ncbi:MAG: aldehyde dehydrogenase family protein, partial [Thermoleophilia bacterium]|nr:aldehyde dehydrogenase family protein [Thermoleophilia bacterium]